MSDIIKNYYNIYVICPQHFRLKCFKLNYFQYESSNKLRTFLNAFNIILLIDIFKYLKKYNSNIVHILNGDGYPISIIVLFYAKILQIKSILTIHDPLAHPNDIIATINKSISRIFNKAEVMKCNNQINKANCFSKRFAAKEAFSKAIGTGISKGINFNEIIVHNIKSGKPNIKLLGNTKKTVNKILNKKKFNIFLSLSDDKPFAVATVVISI